MLIDLFSALVTLFAVFKGWRSGFVIGVFSFISIVVGMAAALKLSSLAAHHLSSATSIPPRLLPFVAFIFVFIVVVLLVRLGAKIIESMIELAMLGWANRVGGVLLYLLMYFFAFSIVLFYAVKLGLLKSQMLQASNTYPLLEPLAPRVISALGALLPWFKNTFGQLEQFFSSLPQDATT